MGGILKSIFSGRKYVFSFRITSDKIYIQYFTSFLKPKTVELDLIHLSGAEMTKANRVADYPTAVNLKYKGCWIGYHIIDKKLFKFIEKHIRTMSTGYP